MNASFPKGKMKPQGSDLKKGDDGVARENLRKEEWFQKLPFSKTVIEVQRLFN